jgi:hypothetical protein
MGRNGGWLALEKHLLVLSANSYAPTFTIIVAWYLLIVSLRYKNGAHYAPQDSRCMHTIVSGTLTREVHIILDMRI